MKQGFGNIAVWLNEEKRRMRGESNLTLLLHGDFSLTEKDRRLYKLAKQYHDETESYDKSVCSIIDDRGVAMPANIYEQRMINRNALKVRQRLLESNPEIEPSELHRAISVHKVAV